MNIKKMYYVVSKGNWAMKWILNLLTFFKKGTVNNLIGTETIKRTSNNLLAMVRSI